jgi:ribosomal protein S18 acetylase RimI-like enzyme
MNHQVEIRAYRPADEPMLYEVCLRTGDAGRDATGLHTDPRLPGLVFVGPYLAFEPALASVLDRGDGTPIGYVLGALSTGAFEARCEREWWPPLRERYPEPAGPELTRDEQLIQWIHHPPLAPATLTSRYPSHLHIDLLPEGQGRGWGRRLMERLLAALAKAGSIGVHLGVARANQNAIGFYRRLGFVEIDRSPDGLTFGMSLAARSRSS